MIEAELAESGAKALMTAIAELLEDEQAVALGRVASLDSARAPAEHLARLGDDIKALAVAVVVLVERAAPPV